MKLKPTHQMINYPHKDVTAWQFDLYDDMPSWCGNFGQVGKTWQIVAKDKTTRVIAHPGDWAVTDGNSMVVLTDEEFRSIYRSL